MDFTAKSIASIKTLGLILIFLSGGAQVLLDVYPNAIFLSAYPPSWLSYFYFGTSVLEIGSGFLLTSLLAKPSNITPAILILVCGFATLVFLVLMQLGFYFTPFVFALYLEGVSLVLGLVVWNAFRNAFDILEYKNISGMAVSLSSLGVILTSAFLAVLLKFANVNILAVLIACFLFMSGALIIVLKPLPFIPSKEVKINPFQYQLFRIIFSVALLVAVTYTLADYCLKYKLSTRTANQIGDFIAEFSLICGILALVIGYFAIQPILVRFKVLGLYLVLPIFWLFSGLLVFFHPTFANIVILASGKSIFYYTILSAGRELTINVLPQDIKNAGNVFLKSFATPFAGIIASIFIFLSATKLPIKYFALSVALLSGIIIFLISKITKLYSLTLRDSLYFNRFSTENLSKKDLSLLKRSIVTSLEKSHNDDDTTYMLLSLIPQLNYEVLSPKLYKYVHSNSSLVRQLTLKLIKSYEGNNAAPEIIKQLSQENDREVMWSLVDTAVYLKSNEVVN